MADMNDDDFNSLLSDTSNTLQSQAPQTAQPDAPEFQPGYTPEPDAQAQPPAAAAPTTAQPASDPSQSQDDAYGGHDPNWLTRPLMDLTEAAGVGALQSLFETKDFLTGGQTPEDQKSGFRKSVESEGERLTNKSWVYGAAIPIAQFTTSMLGIGKVMKIAKVGSLLANAPGYLKAATTAGQAAAAGAIAFDPHGERLSNVIESVPALSNPVTALLMAKPTDTEAESRLKTVAETLGMEAAAAPLFAAAARAYSALSKGKPGLAKSIMKDAADASVDDSPKSSPTVLEGEAAAVGGPEGEGAGAESASASTGPAPKTVAEVFSPADADSVSKSAEPLTPSRPGKPVDAFPEDQLDDVYSKVMGDAQVLNAYGSREAAAMAGHTFGDVELPWQKLATGDDGLDSLIDRLTEKHYENIGREGPNQTGRVISDAAVNRVVQQRLEAWGDNPATTMLMLRQAGDQGDRLAASMEVGDALAVKLSDEAYLTRQKINLGNLDEWGGDRDAAMTQFAQQAGLAMQAMTASRQMLSGAGRALRRARGDTMRMSLDQLRELGNLSPEALGTLFDNADGNLANMRQNLVRTASLGRRIVNEANFWLVNNLMWGWTTQAINGTMNLFEALARPASRIIGAGIQKGVAAVAPESADLPLGLKWTAPTQEQAGTAAAVAMKQYRFMVASVSDAGRMALRTLLEGDSVMIPYGSEQGAVANRARLLPSEFVPVNNLGDWLNNVGASASFIGGIPVRAMAASDELSKQITYRSLVQAEASIDADRRGLVGQDARDFVQQRLNNSFDLDGKALDTTALAEAQRATFNQTLETEGYAGPIAKTIMNGTTQVPLARQILPFVKVPTNLLRRGIQYTPGLNLLQREYQEMFTGMRGPEQQALAFGQMSIGSAIMGTVATMAAHGYITGSMPSNPAAMREMQASGWKANSIAIPDGKGGVTYTQIGRADPVGLMFGMVADIQNILMHPDRRDEADGQISLLLMSLMKQVSDKTYLRGIKQWTDAFSDPDKNFSRAAGQYASSLVPLSSFLKNYGPAVDQNMSYMRDARTVLDGVLAGLPGWADQVPAKRDGFGDQILVRRSPISKEYHDPVDQELIRQSLDFGSPGISAPAPLVDGVPLHELTLSDGTNAYDSFQQWRGHPEGFPSLKDAIGKLIQNPEYLSSVDGPVSALGKSSKQALMAKVAGPYGRYARAKLGQDPVFQHAATAVAEKIKQNQAAQNTEGQSSINQQRTQQGAQNVARQFGLTLPAGGTPVPAAPYGGQ